MRTAFRLSCLLTLAVCSYACSSGGDGTADVKAIQAESQASVPQGIPKVPEDKRMQGVNARKGPSTANR
jgi:hypothetical protein